MPIRPELTSPSSGASTGPSTGPTCAGTSPRPALVVTSIAAPNAVLGALAQGAKEAGWNFTVVGDTKSPSDFSLAGCEYLGVERQRELPFVFARECPTKHYCRKNIAYLIAARRGATQIIETDDDNFPRPEFFVGRTLAHRAPTLSGTGWVNVYGYFVEERVAPNKPAPIWPRGLPLDQIRKPLPALGPVATCEAPIQQGLADENPDVDAVYRLTMPLPVNFQRREPLLLREQAWCPFNSQNTTFFPMAYALAYLPATCSFRMTDIWRSFVAQRIAWANGWGVLFHNATVWQERNAHNLMRDFADEVSGYLHNDAIATELGSLTLLPGVANIPANMKLCYEAMVRKGWVQPLELTLLDAYLSDLASAQREAGVLIEAKPLGAGVGR
jgi:hypothetical protein